MLDSRLQVFYAIAKRMSCTKADDDELYITQPTLTKHIRAPEYRYKSTLFEHNSNKRILLTPASGVPLC